MRIRPMEGSDVEGVAALYERVVRGGEGSPPARLTAWFERVVLGHPWADPEIPSLVAEDGEGGIIGLLTSHVRRVSIDGEPRRLACGGQLAVDPEARRRATGALLLRAYLDGPQDLTITDGATELVRAMWERLGGDLAHPQSIEWVHTIRPGSLGAAVWASRRGRRWPGRGASLAATLGNAAARLPPIRRLHRAPAPAAEPLAAAPPDTQTQPLSAEGFVAALATVAERSRLRPAYDAAFAEWLLGELAAVHTRGELRARLVRDGDGAVLGWFVYYLVARGLSPAISVAAPDESSAGAVLDALFEDARAGGAAGVHGRLEPVLVAPAGARRCLFRYVGQALVHSGDPAVAALATSRHALLTRLEGEWWMDPHLL